MALRTSCCSARYARHPTLDSNTARCGVCHTKPTLVAGLYGPELSKLSAGGREDVIRETITNGTPRMPAFKYTFNPTQIAAIAAYLMTLEPGHQNQPPPTPQR